MNKVYKVIWSKARNCYVVASELAKSHTKSPKSGVMSHALAAGVLACVLSYGAVLPVYAADLVGGQGSQPASTSYGSSGGSISGKTATVNAGTTISGSVYGAKAGSGIPATPWSQNESGTTSGSGGSATSNTAKIYGTVTGAVYGGLGGYGCSPHGGSGDVYITGYAGSGGSANSNQVIVSGGTVDGVIYGGVAGVGGGFRTVGSGYNNSDSMVTSAGNGGTANNNTIMISNNSSVGNIYLAKGGNVTYNYNDSNYLSTYASTVTHNNGTIRNGGTAGNANNNTLTVSNSSVGTTITGAIAGTHSPYSVGSFQNASNAGSVRSYTASNWVTGNAEGNTITLNNVTFNVPHYYDVTSTISATLYNQFVTAYASNPNPSYMDVINGNISYDVYNMFQQYGTPENFLAQGYEFDETSNNYIRVEQRLSSSNSIQLANAGNGNRGVSSNYGTTRNNTLNLTGQLAFKGSISGSGSYSSNNSGTELHIGGTKLGGGSAILQVRNELDGSVTNKIDSVRNFDSVVIHNAKWDSDVPVLEATSVSGVNKLNVSDTKMYADANGTYTKNLRLGSADLLKSNSDLSNISVTYKNIDSGTSYTKNASALASGEIVHSGNYSDTYTPGYVNAENDDTISMTTGTFTTTGTEEEKLKYENNAVSLVVTKKDANTAVFDGSDWTEDGDLLQGFSSVCSMSLLNNSNVNATGDATVGTFSLNDSNLSLGGNLTTRSISDSGTTTTNILSAIKVETTEGNINAPSTDVTVTDSVESAGVIKLRKVAAPMLRSGGNNMSELGGGLTVAGQVKGVTAGTDDTDAVNVAQLNSAIEGASTPYIGIVGMGSNQDGSGAQSANSIAIGASALSAGFGAVTLGTNSLATGNASVAVGIGATTYGANSVAVGSAAFAGTDVNGEPTSATDFNIALGANSRAYGNYAVALGTAAQSIAQNAVAIGSNSIADTVNTVSVGSSTMQRKIVNVANGTAANDAATYGQVSNTIKGLTVSGQTITYTKVDGTTGTITTQDNNTTYSAATTSAAGLMSAADKLKLDGIASGANAYTLPAATSSALGGVKIGSNITNTNGTISLTKANVTAALGYTPPTQDTNTTYDNMSASELSTGTATTARSISAKTIADYVTGKVSAETTARTSAISSEATTRANADTALGTRIDGTIKGLSVNGRTITYTKGDGTTGTITTQDTTYSAGNGLSLSNGSFSVKTDGQVVSGNTGIVTGNTVYEAMEARIGQITVENNAQNTVAVGDGSSVSGDGAIAVGTGSSGSGEGSVAVGGTSTSSGEGSVAVGDTSTSTGEGSVAVGSEASASSTGAVAMGTGSTANSGTDNSNAVAIGNNAQAGTDSTPVTDVTAIGGGSTASGDSGTAIGATSTASGTNTTAVGSGSNASGTGASAIGQGSSATGQGSSALGEGSTAGGTGSVAIGSDANASSSGAIALGNDAVANSGTNNSNATAIGNNAQAGSNSTPVTDATAIGGCSIVSGNSGTAIGATSTASNTNTTAIGSGTTASGAGASAIGQGSIASSADATAVGHGASATGAQSSAIGEGSSASGSDSIAFGSDAKANSSGAVSIGNDASANSGTSNSNAVAIGNNAHAGTTSTSVQNGTAIGGSASVTGTSGTALGANTTVAGSSGTAIGSGASASGQNSIALGAGSVADSANTLSIGTSSSRRRVVNVAAGTSANDAATVAQTYVLQNGTNTTVTDAGTNSIGQHIYKMTVTTDGQVTSGNTGIVTGGTVYDALEARIGQITVQNNAQNTVSLGDNSSVGADGAVAVGSGSSGTGEGSVAVGDTSNSSGEGSVAVGSNTSAQADNSITIGTGSTITGTTSDNSVAIGQQTSITGSDSVALGGGSSVTGSDATAIGGNTVVNNDNSVAIGSGSNASQDNVVSIGHSATDLDSSGTAYGSELNRRIVNVADGVDEHDAVTKGQLDTLLQNNVGSLNTNGNYILKSNSTADNMVLLDNQIKSVADNSVAYASNDKGSVVYGGTNGTVLRNVKGGAINETSMEVVNGSQLYSVKQDLSGFVADIRRNSDNIRTLNSSVTSALSSVSASGLLVDTMDASKADASLNNLTESGKQIIKTYAANAVQEYMAAQGLSTPAAPLAIGNTNSNALTVTDAGNGSLHVGEGSYVNGTSSIAIGVGNQVNANNSGAFGDPSIINADASYVLGNDDTINTGATGSFIVGNNGVSDAKGGLLFGSNTVATADAEDGMALGNRAEVSAKNAIALGSGSIADTENTLSIGNTDLKRKIVNVADGDISQNSSEAVTGAQLFVTNEKVQQNTKALENKAEVDASNINTADWSAKLGIGQVQDGNTDLVTGGTVYDAIKDIGKDNLVQSDGQSISIGKADTGNFIDVRNASGEGRVIMGVVVNPQDETSAANVGYVNAVGENILKITNNAFQKVDTKVNKVGASAAAMANLPTPTFEGEEKWAFAAGVGHYRGETAGAVGAFYKPTDNVIARVSGSFGNGDEMVGAGVAVSLNKANTPVVSKAQLVRTINAQANEIQQVKQENALIRTENANMKADYEGKIAAQNEEIAQLKAMMTDLAAKVK